jgi:hypothetical protein
LTGLNNWSGQDRRMITVLAVIGITVAVFMFLGFRCSSEWLFWAPLGVSCAIRVAARVMIAEEKKVAQETNFFRSASPPILSFFRKAGTIEGAPFRAWSAPLHVGEMMGYIG